MKVLFALYSLGILALLFEIQALDFKIEPEKITQHGVMVKEDNRSLFVDGNVASCMEINRKSDVSFKITGYFRNLQARIYTEGMALSSLGNDVEVRIKSTSNSNVRCTPAGINQRESTYVSFYNCSSAGSVESPTVTVCIVNNDNPLTLCEVEFYATKDSQDIESLTLPTTHSDTTENNISDERQFNATRAFRRNKHSTSALIVIIVCCLVSFATAVMGVIIFINHWIDVRKRNKSRKTKNTSPRLDAKSKLFYCNIETGHLSDASEASKVQTCSSFKPKKKETLASVEENEQNDNSSAEPVVKQSYPESVDDNLKDCAIYDSKEMLEDKNSEVAMTENELYTSVNSHRIH